MTARARWNDLRSLGLLALLCAVPLALGWDAPPEKKVRVSVVVILASETDAKVCKKLECIAREVTKMHPNLTGFRMGEMACESLKTTRKSWEKSSETRGSLGPLASTQAVVCDKARSLRQ